MDIPSGSTLPEAPVTQPTPAAPENTQPEPGSSPDPVDELKNQVARAESRAATAQKSADELEKKLRIEHGLRVSAERRLAGGSGIDGGGVAPAAVPMDDREAESERLKAERGISNLLLMNPAYQKVLEGDATLREILLDNPLSLIREYIDFEDAVDQVKRKLDVRLEALEKRAEVPAPVAPATREVPAPSGQAPAPGTLTPQSAREMTREQWAALTDEQRDKLKMG